MYRRKVWVLFLTTNFVGNNSRSGDYSALEVRHASRNRRRPSCEVSVIVFRF